MSNQTKDTSAKGKRGSFASGFGFLMAAVGSAVGLGNIWGFPYKMGANGGFAFILIYLLLAIFLGFPLMTAEIAIGRKTQKSAILAFRAVDRRFVLGGFADAIAPFALLCFYCVLGGMVMKYMVGNFGDIIGASWGINGAGGADYFGALVGNPAQNIIWMLIFLGLTAFIIMRGVESGIEKFSAVAMPCLYVLLIVTAIRCCTLPGAADGLAFMFKPDFTVFKGTGWLKVFAAAGSQLFFSLSLASGCIIAYGSYLKKDENIERHAIMIPVLDTLAALLAGICVMPAVFAAGIEPSGGPGLLFVSLQDVFHGMGTTLGPIFGFIFYLLVFIASLTSSVGMMEGAVSVLIDHRLDVGKSGGRKIVTCIAIITTLIGGLLVAIDQLGGNTAMWKPLGLGSWLDVFDLIGEGIAMPLGGLLLALMLGWAHRNFIDDEVLQGSPYRTRGFVNFCLHWISPILMIFILIFQFSTFFFSGTGWYQALFG